MRFNGVLTVIGILASTIIISSCSESSVKYYGNKYADQAEAILRTKELSDDDPAVREKAAYRLAEVGERDNEEMLAALIKVAESDESDPVRIAAFAALRRFGFNQAGVWETGMNAMEDDNPDIRAAASYIAVRQAKAEYAMEPRFREWLSDPDPSVRQRVRAGLSEYYYSRERPDFVTAVFVDALSDEDPGVRFNAARILAEWGVEPERVIATYIDLLDDPLYKTNVMFHAGEIEPPAIQVIPYLLEIFYKRPPVPDVENLIADAESVTQLEKTLGESYPDSYFYAKIVSDKPDRVETKKNTNSNFLETYFYWNNGRQDKLYNIDQERVWPDFAISTAARISMRADVLAALMVALYDENPMVRMSAVSSLSRHVPETIPMLPRIIEIAQQDKDMNVRLSAISQLGAFAGQAPAAVLPVLMAALDDETVRGAAARALRNAGPAAVDAVPALRARLNDRDEKGEYEYITSFYTEAVISIELASGDALPSLVELLNSDNYNVRDAAAQAMSEFGEDAIPYLVGCFDDESGWVRNTAAGSIGDIAKENPGALPYVIDALKNEDISIAEPAASFFRSMENPPEEIIPILIDILDEIDLRTGMVDRPGLDELMKWKADDLAFDSICILGLIGPAASDAVPSLARLLGSDDRGIYYNAFRALQQIGAASAKAMPELREVLYAKSAQKRAMAAHTIGVIGPGASDAVGDLIKLLDDENPGARREAATSLGLIGLNSGEVMAALKNASENDGNVVVRKAAAMAIEKLEGEADA